MATNYGPEISTDGLVLCLDAANPKSYPGTGTTWYDISGSGGTNFIINASAYNSTGPKYMDFNGSYGCAITSNGVDTAFSGTVTAVLWTRILNNSSNWRTLFRAETSGTDHQVIIQAGGWEIGMYDNVNETGFNSSGFSQQSLPGYGTSQWNMLVWRWVSTQNNFNYYTFSYNDSPETIRGSISSSNARFKTGFRTLGAYNASAPSQFWGDIAYIAMYNRRIDDGEVRGIFQAQRGRYGV
jgi:hypothetical protein